MTSATAITAVAGRRNVGMNVGKRGGDPSTFHCGIERAKYCGIVLSSGSHGICVVCVVMGSREHTIMAVKFRCATIEVETNARRDPLAGSP